MISLHSKVIDVSWFLTLFGIRQNQAFSSHFRQDQAKSGTNKLLEPRVHVVHMVVVS